MNKEENLLKIIRCITVFYILSLVFWGVTAFPLQWEMDIACKILSISPDVSPETYTGFKFWIAHVYEGLSETNSAYPFLAYGTDWLAFSHLVIAVAFIGVYVKPVRNIWIVYFGMIACLGVIPLALICGAIREIPFYWRMIDCSFSVSGIIPLLLLRKYIKQLELLTGKTGYKY
jgi:hypothetical protein